MSRFLTPDMIPVIALLTACSLLALVGLTMLGLAIMGKLPRVKTVLGLSANVGLLGFAGLCVKIILATLSSVQKVPTAGR
jgi:hypothetical protein